MVGSQLEDLWINILPEGGTFRAHSSPFCDFGHDLCCDARGRRSNEDPRHAMMMAAPAIKEAREEMRNFIYVAPVVGDVLLWESWPRQVPMNMSEDDRISASLITVGASIKLRNF